MVIRGHEYLFFDSRHLFSQDPTIEYCPADLEGVTLISGETKDGIFKPSITHLEPADSF